MNAFWSLSAEDILRELNASYDGLTSEEAAARLERCGPNLLRKPEKHGAIRLLLRQFASPIAVMLFVTALVSAFVGELTDAIIILIILSGSGLLGFWQERNAGNAIAALLALIETRARVRRDGREVEIPTSHVVPGDLLILRAGDIISADARAIEEKDLDVDESALTGESFPVPKQTEAVSADAALAQRSSAVFAGTHVASGSGTAIVVATGANTLYGQLAEKIAHAQPPSEFEHGVRRFGYFLLEMTVVLVLIIFAINVALHRPVLDVMLFSLALAVGLTPQLLPAILSITLAHGAREMARREVIVRRLVAIEDFGGMNVLCLDKTGTLTEGTVRVRGEHSPDGKPSERVARLAYINAALQSGFDNPIDRAIRTDRQFDLRRVRKLDEVPYDFVRRRLSVLVNDGGQHLLVTKGAVPEVLGICSKAEMADGSVRLLEDVRSDVEKLEDELSRQGVRTIAVAYRPFDSNITTATREHERDLVFAGLVSFTDPPKPGVRDSLDRVEELGITVKMVTGDNHLVAQAIAREVDLPADTVLTGNDLREMTGIALTRRVATADIFAEVDPNQKEQIIRALRASGASVGFLGDGINDAAALHAADVGISVDTAVDVTKEAADIVLLRKDLNVLADAVQEGRRSFANTLKYVFITTSARFGNMFSMAGASLISTFLPMLPKQILLLNLLGDVPTMTIATDRLDPELVSQPRRWDVHYIRDFMIVFGLISSFFDYVTFGVLMWFAVPPAQFRTGWFIESVLSEIFTLLMIRTARPFYTSPPSRPLLYATIGVGIFSVLLPYVPGSGILGFTPIPMHLLVAMLIVTVALVFATEFAKRIFFPRHLVRTPPAVAGAR